MFLNILLIAFTLAALALFVYYIFTREVREERVEVRFSYDSLKQDVKDMINEYVGVSVAGLGLAQQESQNQEAKRRAFATSVRECCSGNAGARDSVQEFIRIHLTRERGLNEQNIIHAIPFNRPNDMSAKHLMNAMILHFDGGEDKGFQVLLNEYNIAAPKFDNFSNAYYDITERDVRATFELIGIRLSLEEQIAVLVQGIYEDLFGLGAIDLLNQQKGSVEEIQIGMTGVQAKSYNYKHNLVGMEKKQDVVSSKDAIHVLIHGEVVRMSYLSFGTEDEKQRVIRNLIKGCDAGELTIKNPKISVDAVDGRRLNVGRPPFTDAWVGFVRKFDSVVISSLDEMYTDVGDGEIAVGILRQLVRAGFGIVFTGEMASGKTSLFRAALKETRPDLSIRTIEAGSFELDTRQHLPGRNTLAMRITEWTPEEDVLAFARKTTGNCFCIGEINSLRMAVLTMAVSKISLQTMSSAHYVTTEEMIADFTNANLCTGGYTSEKLAEMDAVRALGFDVHIKKRNGKRYISSITEIIPEFNFNRGFSDDVAITDNNAPVQMVEALREMRVLMGRTKTYSLRKILEYDEDKDTYICYDAPSEARRIKAKEYMSASQYDEYVAFFDTYFGENSVVEESFGTADMLSHESKGLLSASGNVVQEDFSDAGCDDNEVQRVLTELAETKVVGELYESIFNSGTAEEDSLTGMEELLIGMEA